MEADTKLHEAVHFGDTNLVESALEDGANPNSIGLYGWSPMHEAASNGDTEVLDLLIQFKGDPNCSDDLEGCTPVHYAAREGHTDCLRALLKAGGHHDTENNGGKSPLDEASEECRPILDKERTKSLLNMTLDAARITVSKSKPVGSEGQRSEVVTSKVAGSTQDDSGRIKSPRAWDSIKVSETKKKSPGKTSMTGSLQLSFEYNSKTKTFKIRVWALQDILLPPAEFSNLSRIYIRGHLLPDKKGESKRKTDEIRIDDPAKMMNSLVTLKRKGSRDSFKAVFLPSTFKFSKALEYQNVSQEMVDSKTVHVAVCVRQRYSTKTIPVAIIQLPMKEAVRKLLKEKYQLHSCINYSMPTNIHAYNPHDIVVISEGMYNNMTTSHPTLRTKSRQSLDVDENNARASSDINLQAVRCHSVESVPSATVDIDSVQKETALDDLLEVSIRRDDPGDTKANKKVTVVDVHELPSSPPATPLPGNIEDGELTDVSVVSSSRQSPDSATIDMEGLETINLDREPMQASSTPMKSRHAKIKHGFDNPHVTIVDDGEDEDFEVSIDKKSHRKWTRDKDAIIDIGVGDHGDDKKKGIKGHLFKKRGKHKKNSKGDGIDNPGYVVDMRTGKRSLLGDFSHSDGQYRPGELEMLEILSDEEADLRFSSKNSNQYSGRTSGHANHLQETVIDVGLPSVTGMPGRKSKAYDVRGAMKKEDLEVTNTRRKHPENTPTRKDVGKTEELIGDTVPSRELNSPIPVIHVECVDEVERSTSPGSKSPRSPRSPRQARRVSPVGNVSASGHLSTQQEFPPPVTKGLPHTDLTNVRNEHGVDSKHKGTSENIQKPKLPLDFQFISEIDKVVDNSTLAKTPAREKERKTRSKSPGHRHKKSPQQEEGEFEMLTLWKDEEWRKKLGTPNFKLQMFQRTSDDPHPSSPLLKKYHTADPSRGVIHNPAYVPETPPNQTDMDTPTREMNGAKVKRKLHNSVAESTRNSEL
ncbi:uncharacterized protein LOC121427431 [Lytechinus variegatus]|uniref:uncharacterized protein LOC121427431 n=1 Tax=Lytechinus variegatus TaxID=7654 RepID=UPI001BB20621|nr:uncharacterized protein LOC121427431 [Lytechinus variegatus]